MDYLDGVNISSEITQKELFNLGDEIDVISDISIEVPFEILRKYNLISSSGRRNLLDADKVIDMGDLANQLITFYQPSEKTRFDPYEEKYDLVLRFIEKMLHQIYSSYDILTKRDLKLSIDFLPLRINISRSTVGDFISVRIHSEATPYLEDLILPFGMYEMLMNQTPAKGGLYLFAAENGQGKSTTMGACLLSLLKKDGVFAVTIEDPCELNLSGFVGKEGRCIQTEISINRSFEDASSDAARQFHASGGGVLLLGEIRDAVTADMAIRFANRGIKVLSTVHARSVNEVISMILNYVSAVPGNNLKIAREAIAHSLRFISCQELVQNNGLGMWDKRKIKSKILYNPHGLDNISIRNALNDESLKGVEQIMDVQNKRLKKAMTSYLSAIGSTNINDCAEDAINKLKQQELKARSDAYHIQFYNTLKD